MADSSSRKSGAAAPRTRQAQNMGESSSKKLIRILLMIVCCAGAAYFFWTTLQIISDNEEARQEMHRPQPPDPVTETEKSEIASAEESLQNVSKSSSQAMQIALLAEVQNKYPVDLPVSLVVNQGPNPGPIEPVIEPEPPMLTVMGILDTGTDKSALVNVDGEQGVLMRVGTKFSEGKARITKIDAKGVTFTWMKKSYQVSVF
ncbi:MAG: hypothetical protein LBU26_06965 [Synergistaceae bacterium]|jgi:hypothetical protein|nr:hypothetical protein [Synergistaceae bacterium]